jgi:hypothetical protein
MPQHTTFADDEAEDVPQPSAAPMPEIPSSADEDDSDAPEAVSFSRAATEQKEGLRKDRQLQQE